MTRPMTHVYIVVAMHWYHNPDAARWSDNYNGSSVPVLRRITETYEEAFAAAAGCDKIYEAPLNELLRTYSTGYADLRELPGPTRKQLAARRAAKTRKANAARKAKTK